MVLKENKLQHGYNNSTLRRVTSAKLVIDHFTTTIYPEFLFLNLLISFMLFLCQPLELKYFELPLGVAGVGLSFITFVL